MTDNKKELSDHLLDAMSHENLSTRETAKILNLNPGYISMAKNPNLFNTMSKFAWERIEEWHDSRDKLKDFHPTLLEGEEIWKPKPVVAEKEKPIEVKHSRKMNFIKNRNTPETKLNVNYDGDGLKFTQKPEPEITVGQAIDVLIKAGAKFKVKLDI